jgi:hypothetical protein
LAHAFSISSPDQSEGLSSHHKTSQDVRMSQKRVKGRMLLDAVAQLVDNRRLIRIHSCSKRGSSKRDSVEDPESVRQRLLDMPRATLLEVSTSRSCCLFADDVTSHLSHHQLRGRQDVAGGEGISVQTTDAATARLLVACFRLPLHLLRWRKVMAKVRGGTVRERAGEKRHLPDIGYPPLLLRTGYSHVSHTYTCIGHSHLLLDRYRCAA